MADLNAAASAAGLSDKQKKQIDRLNKALETHKTLLNLPATVASDAYNNKLTPKEQQDLKDKFGQESPEEKPNRGWLGTAWHYTGGKVFEAAQALSDLSTRVARTGIIAAQEGRDLSDAWDRAEKDGQKVFNGRLEDLSAFHRRRFCSLTCANTRRTPLTKHGYSYRARKHLGKECEACGHSKSLHAHHIDQDNANNSKENIQTLCKHCHNFWHTTQKRRGWSIAGRMPKLF